MIPSRCDPFKFATSKFSMPMPGDRVRLMGVDCVFVLFFLLSPIGSTSNTTDLLLSIGPLVVFAILVYRSPYDPSTGPTTR